MHSNCPAHMPLAPFESDPQDGARWPESRVTDWEQLARKLCSALDDLLTEVQNLEGYTLTRDVESYKAQACWDDAIGRAENAYAMAQKEFRK